jgi:hypothetical protein
MMLAVPLHFRKASLHPTPSSHSRTIERLEERQEIHVNVPKCRHAVGGKEGEILHGPTAGVLEVDSSSDPAGSGVPNSYARGRIRTWNANGTLLLLDPDVKGEIRHIKVARNCLADHGFSLIELPHM